MLWIDAICINQYDLAERSEEVGKMAHIYSHASRVVVWLGEESETSALAFRTIRDIARDVESIKMTRRPPAMTTPNSNTWKLEEDGKMMREMVLNWISIRDLFAREWFRRLWIFQEIGLASSAVMVIGVNELKWEEFRAIAAWLNSHVVTGFMSEIIHSKDLTRGRALIQIYTDEEGQPTERLDKLLIRTRYQSCLDPRDRIYAVLSLVYKEYQINISPDYSKPVEEVYKEFVLRHMEHSRSLLFTRFCLPQSRRNISSLPSWVPDFSASELLPNLIKYANASGKSELDSRYNERDNSLRISGVLAGSVSKVSTSMPNAARVIEILAVANAWTPQDLYTAKYIDGGTLLKAFIGTLINDFVNESHPPTTEEAREVFEKTIIDGKIGYRERQECEIENFISSLERVLPGRAFSELDNGYIGLCPAGTEPGDRIVVVLGCGTPLAIRPVPEKPGRHKLIGPCYIHGMMDCEMLLGPLLRGWSITGYVRHAIARTPTGGSQTLHDPRLGALPEGWRFRYGRRNNLREVSADRDGVPRAIWFENRETGEVTGFDPRLNFRGLEERGVDMRDFVLI